MNRKDVFLNIVSPIGAGLLVLFISFIFNDKSEIRAAGFFGSIITTLSWVLYYRLKIYIPEQKENRDKYLWTAKKEKEPPKIIFSIDFHKSSNWDTDNLVFLCIHNESFFKDIRNLSVVVAHVMKIDSDETFFALNRSVILEENITVKNKKSITDVPFLKVIKQDSKFVIRAIHQESQTKEIFEHEFGYGKYIIHVVIKRNDVKRDSMAIPVHVKYDGWDKITVKIGEEFPRHLLTISL